MISIIAGSVIGAVAQTYMVLLGSRLIEGLGLMFLSAIGPAAVAKSFTGKNSGTAMGLLMCYMSFGQIVALNAAPFVAEISSWREFWWISAAFGGVDLFLWLILVRESDSDQDRGETEKIPLSSVLRNKSVWYVCITFLTYMIVHFGVFNYLPTYMTEIGGINATAAGTLTSIASLIGIPVGVVGGMIADKCGSIKRPLSITMLLFAVLVAMTPLFSSKNYGIYVVIYGIVAMAEAGLSFAAVTKVVSSEEGAVASAMLNTAQWIGAFLSTILFGVLLDLFGWNISFYLMVPIVVIGVLTSALNKALN